MSAIRKDEKTGLDIKVSPELNLHQVSSDRPSYLYRKVYPANGGARTIAVLHKILFLIFPLKLSIWVTLIWNIK